MPDLASSFEQFMGSALPGAQPDNQSSGEDLAQSLKSFMGDSWSDFSSDAKDHVEKVDLDQQYRQNPYSAPAEHRPYYTLEAARADAQKELEKDKTLTDPVTQYVAGAMPFVSSILGANSKREYKQAVDRYQANEYGDDYKGQIEREKDARKIATFERDQSAAQQFQAGHPIASAASHAQAMVSEALIGGQLLKVAGGVLPSVQVAPAVVPQLAAGGAKLAATTAVMPSLYAEDAAQRSIEQGGDITSAKNAGPAFVKAMITNAILGKLGGAAEGLTGSVPTMVGRAGARAMVGGVAMPVEQQAADTVTSVVDNVLPESLQFKTKYGLVGKWVRGEQGTAREAGLQVLMGAAFAQMHGGDDARSKYMNDFGKAMDRNYAKGEPESKALRASAEEAETLNSPAWRVPDYKTSNPDTSVDAGIRELMRGSVGADSFWSTDPDQAAAFHKPGMLRFEVDQTKLDRPTKMTGKSEVLYPNGDVPLGMDPGLKAVEFKGEPGSEQGQRLQAFMDDLNAERQKAGLPPVRFEAKTGKEGKVAPEDALSAFGIPPEAPPAAETGPTPPESAPGQAESPPEGEIVRPGASSAVSGRMANGRLTTEAYRALGERAQANGVSMAEQLRNEASQPPEGGAESAAVEEPSQIEAQSYINEQGQQVEISHVPTNANHRRIGSDADVVARRLFVPRSQFGNLPDAVRQDLVKAARGQMREQMAPHLAALRKARAFVSRLRQELATMPGAREFLKDRDVSGLMDLSSLDWHGNAGHFGVLADKLEELGLNRLAEETRGIYEDLNNNPNPIIAKWLAEQRQKAPAEPKPPESAPAEPNLENSKLPPGPPPLSPEEESLTPKQLEQRANELLGVKRKTTESTVPESFQQLLDQADLTPRERALLQERANKSLDAIVDSNHPQLLNRTTGRSLTKQRLQQLEAEAIKKLDPEATSVADLISRLEASRSADLERSLREAAIGEIPEGQKESPHALIGAAEEWEQNAEEEMNRDIAELNAVDRSAGIDPETTRRDLEAARLADEQDRARAESQRSTQGQAGPARPGETPLQRLQRLRAQRAGTATPGTEGNGGAGGAAPPPPPPGSPEAGGVEPPEPNLENSKLPDGQSPQGMGAAGGVPPGPGAPVGAPGASAPSPEPQQQRARTGLFQQGVDFLKSFAQKSFPALTRLAQDTGAKLASATKSQTAASAKATWNYLSNVLKIGDVRLADAPEDLKRATMATWYERRFREYRDNLLAQAAQAKTPEEAKSLRDQAAAVRTFIGQPGSPLKTEADYQEMNQNLWNFWEAIRQEWRPLVDKNFKEIRGMDDAQTIDSISQIPGLPFNAIAVSADTPGAVAPGATTGPRQGMGNLRFTRPGFTRKASLSAEAYDIDMDRVMQTTLNKGISAARRNEALRQGIRDGVIAKVGGSAPPPKDSYDSFVNNRYITTPDKEPPLGWHHEVDATLGPDNPILVRDTEVPQGFKYLGLEPSADLAGLDPGAQYYAHPEAYRDLVQGFGLGERPAEMMASGLRPAMDLLYNVALMSPVELATHIGNHVTALFRPGMGTPLWNLKDSFAKGWRIFQRDPAILEDVRKLTELSAAFGHDAKGGVLKSVIELGRYIPGVDPERVSAIGEKVGRFDPTTYVNRLTSGMIDIMQKAVRLQLADAYDKMVDSGMVEYSDSGKRDFINQAVGNYNTQASNRVAQFLKDSGLQSFATAAHTFTTQGIKATFGGAINAKATDMRSALALRGIAALKLVPALAVGPALNYMIWGQAFPKGVPAFAVKTSQDDDKIGYFDPLAFTGQRRGARAVGLNAAIEGSREGKTIGQIIDRATGDIALSGAHLFAGPPAQAVYTGLTGKDATGRMVAPQVSKATTAKGAARAERLGKPAPGSSQSWENVKAAARGVNPIIKSVTEPSSTPKTWIENLMQSMGPFGIKTRPTDEAIQRARKQRARVR